MMGGGYAETGEAERILEDVLSVEPRLAEDLDALDVATWVALVEPEDIPSDNAFRVRHEVDRVVIEFRERGRWDESPPLPAHDLAFLGRIKWDARILTNSLPGKSLGVG